MGWLILASVILVLLFGFVLMFGAPYLPTLKRQRRAALDLLSLKSGQTMIELGCGDGRMLKDAAERGIICIGYELNPLLALWCWLTTRRYGNRVRIKWADFWSSKLPEADGIYVFLLDRYMGKLHTKITQEIGDSVKVVSYAFKFPNVKSTTSRDGLYLYELKGGK